MYSQKNNEHENEKQSKAVAYSCGLKKNGNSCRELADNRPLIVSQRKLQRMTDKRVSAHVHDTVQRMVDTSSFLKTQHGQYMVDSQRDRYLFSKNDAEAPMPTGLYHMTTDQEAATKQTIKVWIPNVKFINKEERAFIENSESTEVGRFVKHNRILSDKHLDIRPKMDSVASINPREGVIPATEGAFGKNDCNLFATRLQHMIAHEKMMAQGGTDPYKPMRNIDDVHTADKEDLEVGVGDKMVHMFPETETCNYHAATIVAKDGQSTVTLEGHVSKNLEMPQFHIRNGVKGFVRDNDTQIVTHLFGAPTVRSRGLGGKVQINPLESVANPVAEKQRGDQRYRIMKGQEDGFDVHASRTFMQQDLGTVNTDSPVLQQLAQQIAEELGDMYGWSKIAVREFAQSPEALQKAVIRLNSMKKPTPSYIY